MAVHATKAQRGDKRNLMDVHPALIIARLRMAGWSLRKLSAAHGLAPKTLQDAMRRPWPRGEQIIAGALKCSPRELWPSRYQKRRSRRGKAA